MTYVHVSGVYSYMYMLRPVCTLDMISFSPAVCVLHSTVLCPVPLGGELPSHLLGHGLPAPAFYWGRPGGGPLQSYQVCVCGCVYVCVICGICRCDMWLVCNVLYYVHLIGS